MKKAIFTILIVISVIISNAQDFAPIGAQWYYDERFAFSGDIDYIKFTSDKDTVILGETCRKITKRHKLYCNGRPDVEYIFYRNDTVFFLDTVFNEFQILYVFSAVTGDSWSIKFKDENQNIDTLTISVDSVSSTLINGQNLKTLYVTYSKNNDTLQQPYTSTIIERIGDIHYMFNWTPLSSSMACDANYTSGLRCYEDSILGFYPTGIADSCNYTYSGNNDFEYSKSFELFPNPTQDEIEIKAKKFSNYTLYLFDLSGKQVKSYKVYGSKFRIDLSSVEKGIYIIRLQTDKQVIGYKKLIKE